MQDVKEKVEERRKELGLGQTALAAKIGISSAFLSDLLNGNRGQNSWPRYKPLIEEALGISLDEPTANGVKEPAA